MLRTTIEQPPHRGTAKRVLPRLRTLNPLSSVLAFGRDPLGFLTALTNEYGDIVQFRLLHLPIVVLNHPDFVKRVLLDNHANYDKDNLIFRLLRPILGLGLVTNVGGKAWLRQRRLIQPAFHRGRIAAMGRLMTGITSARLQDWEAYADRGQVIDVAEEMTLLTLQIVSRALFSFDMSDRASAFGGAFAETNRVLTAFARFPFPPLTFPTPSHLRLWKAVRGMDAVAYGLIRERRERGEDTGDLLSMLLLARDEETGEGMSDQQVRDEVMTALLAGHETSANALSWAWYLLAAHPEVEDRLHAELDTLLAGRLPTVEDLPRLAYLRSVVEETLRLYPPTWQLMRRAIGEDEIGGYRIPAGTTLFWSQYLLHRHAAFWREPERFDPERFAPDQVAERHRYAHMPFGTGPRMCIGAGFAMTEIMLILATIAQRYRLLLASQQTVEPLATLALRPRHGVPVCLVRRCVE